jgi:hypothetical protein
MKPIGHNNYYGLMFGGSGLEGPQQSYLYFLVAQDGTWLIKRRDGDATKIFWSPATMKRAEPSATTRSLPPAGVSKTPAKSEALFTTRGSLISGGAGAGLLATPHVIQESRFDRPSRVRRRAAE